MGHVDTNLIDKNIKIIQDEDPMEEEDLLGDEDEDEDENEDVDHLQDKGHPQGVVLKEDKLTSQPQPPQLRDVQIPPDVDFGVDKIANREVIDAISGDEREDKYDDKVKKLFQIRPKNQRKKISLVLNHQRGKTPIERSEDVDHEDLVEEGKGRSKGEGKRKSEDQKKCRGEDDGGEEDDGEGEDGEGDDGEGQDGEGDDGEGEDGEGEEEDGDEGDDGEGGDGEGDDGEGDDGEGGDGEGGGQSMSEGRDDEGMDSEGREGEVAVDDGSVCNDESIANIGSIEEFKKKYHRNMNKHELMVVKRKELALLERLSKKGFKTHKKYTMVDKLDEIMSERKRLEDDRGCEESVKWQRKILMMASTGIEYLNKSYDPFDIKLDGWSESIYENINDYDEVFEELYHKYKNKVKVAPEIKLIGMVAGSALMFHFSKTLFSKASDQVPGFEDVMRDNPEIKNAYEQAALKKMNMNGGQSNSPMSAMIGNFLGNPMLGNMVGGLLGQQGQRQPQGQQQGQQQQGQQQSQQQQSQQQQRQGQQQQNRVITKPAPITPIAQTTPNIEIDGPSGVDDLLNSLTKGTNADLAEIELSDIETTGTLSEIGSNIKNVNFHNKRTTKSKNSKNRVKLNLK
jgi:hypothetical protein